MRAGSVRGLSLNKALGTERTMPADICPISSVEADASCLSPAYRFSVAQFFALYKIFPVMGQTFQSFETIRGGTVVLSEEVKKLRRQNCGE